MRALENIVFAVVSVSICVLSVNFMLYLGMLITKPEVQNAIHNYLR